MRSEASVRDYGADQGGWISKQLDLRKSRTRHHGLPVRQETEYGKSAGETTDLWITLLPGGVKAIGIDLLTGSMHHHYLTLRMGPLNNITRKSSG